MSLFDDLQTDVTALLLAEAPDRCDVLRSTAASDGGGGETAAPAAAVGPTNIPCFYEPKKSFERTGEERFEAVSDYVIYLPVTHTATLVDVKGSDQIRVAVRGNQPIRIFEVTGVEQMMGVIVQVRARLLNQ